MATRPIICPYTEPEGFVFYRRELALDSNRMTTPKSFMDLSLLSMPIQAFSRSQVNLKPSACALLSQSDIGGDDGYVNFIAFKAIFPETILEKDKYFTWEYRGAVFNAGELTVLSGQNLSSFSSQDGGWDLSKPSNNSNNGGIILCNPHTDKKIKLEILICR